MVSDQQINIRQVGNGFIVTAGEEHTLCLEHVFQSMAELVNYISKHFSHRSSVIHIDPGD